MKPPAPLPSLRRGLGALLMAGAAAHAGLMAFALLYAYDRLPGVAMSVEDWHRLYRMHAGVLALSMAAYLLLRSRREDVLWLQPAVDGLFGLIALKALFWGASRAIHWQLLPPWVSLFPALMLGFYGWNLYRGRQVRPLEVRF